MASNSEFNIFRVSRRRAPASELVFGLRTELRTVALQAGPDEVNSLLLRAGELECGLLDAQAPAALCEQASHLTDLFAAAALARHSSPTDHRKVRGIVAAALPIVERISCPQLVSVSVPEGFAYYAMHPLDYADLIASLSLDATSALVVGVPSIGTTLSAVVAARLRELCVSASRITVRPTGHPYDRVCEFDAAKRRVIASSVAEEAEFLVCDEGPGRSGSSLLSVAEALERAGVPRVRIRILCSHEPEVGALCAPDAARRWRRYRSVHVGLTRRLPPDAAEPLGAGQWRRMLVPDRDEWPALWPQFEPLRYAGAGGVLISFEGHGHYGAAVRARNQAMSEAGFAPSYIGQEAGFGKHVAPQGRAARRADLTAQLLTRMAEYCAWRAREFRAADVDGTELETMTRVNFEREFGTTPEGPVLPVERPTICDARMMPHAWLQTEEGKYLKLDAAMHGDDHFFPGPCDIAWDLAGIVVEWELDAPSREFLLSRYRQAGGDNASHRMEAYELAYATFRMAWSRMATAPVGDAEEENRLMRDYRKYRESLRRFRIQRLLDTDGQEESSREAEAINLAHGGSTG